MTVVQEQDVAGGEALGEPREHLVRISFAGIEAAPGPARQLQVVACQYRFEEGVAQPGRATKELRPAAAEAGQRRLSGADLVLEAGRTEQREAVPVVLTVVLDVVAAPDDLGDQPGMPFGAAADAEKSGLRIVRGEQFEDRRRDFGVRPVVDGDGDFPAGGGGGRQAAPVGTEQAAARPQPGGGEQQVIDAECE